MKNLNNNKPTLTVIRGLPGSGKTTVAEMFGIEYFEADQYFYTRGVYEFRADWLGLAHQWCFDQTEIQLKCDEDVVVSNTFTTEKELNPYKELAEKYDANFVSIIVENRHGNKSIHDVPEETIERMKNRFSIKL